MRKRSKLSLLVVSLAVSLVLAESIARFGFPEYGAERSQRVMFWQYDENLGWFHKPSQVGRFIKDNFNTHVRINSLGLRNGEIGDKEEEIIRLVVLGDSFVWGYGVEEEDRFTNLIDSSSPSLEAINMGVCGYSTDQELLLFENKGIALDPDVVLLMFHFNDWDQNLSPRGLGYPKPYFSLEDAKLTLENVPVPRMGLAMRTATFTRRHLVLPNLIWYRLELLQNWFKLRQAITRGLHGDAPVELVANKVLRSGTPMLKSLEINELALALALIGRFRDQSQQVQASLALVFVPLPSFGGRKLERLAVKRDVLRQGVEEMGIHVLDLTSAFDKADTRDLYIEKDYHWNSTGHSLAAREIHRFLIAHSLI